MAKKYSIPPLLPIWLIALMVVAPGIPVGAYIGYYQEQVKTHEDLEKKIDVAEKQLADANKEVARLPSVLLEKERYELIAREMGYRFFRDVDQAATFFQSRIASDTTGLRRTDKLRSYRLMILGDDTDYIDICNLDGFEQEYTRELLVASDWRGLHTFLKDLYSLTETLRYSPAVYVETRIPTEAASLPSFDSATMFRVGDLRLYLERNEDSGPARRDERGKVWYVGKMVQKDGKTQLAMPDEDLQSAKSIVPLPEWTNAMDELHRRVGMPVLNVGTYDQVKWAEGNRGVDFYTDSPFVSEEVPIFFYIRSFHLRGDPTPTNNELALTVVFPCRERSSVDESEDE
jgi:hypothetical protein